MQFPAFADVRSGSRNFVSFRPEVFATGSAHLQTQRLQDLFHRLQKSSVQGGLLRIFVLNKAVIDVAFVVIDRTSAGNAAINTYVVFPAIGRIRLVFHNLVTTYYYRRGVDIQQQNRILALEKYFFGSQMPGCVVALAAYNSHKFSRLIILR